MTADRSRNPLPATVVALGWVSFCTDLGSEMIVPLLPGFVLSLGGSRALLGLLQGASDAVVALLRVLSGVWSDRLRTRKPWVVAGYAGSAVLRPLMAVVATPLQALLVRVGDRVGKGLRSAPRDALVADVVDAGARGHAFGWQRAMDHAGALCGTLVAFALLTWGLSMRAVFAWAAVPGAVGVVVLVLAVRERRRTDAPPPRAAPGELRALLPFLGVVFAAAFGAHVELLLLARALELGVPGAQAPLLWALLHLVRAGLATPLGALSDRIGRRGVIAAGLGAQALVLAAFAFAASAWVCWVLFALLGLHAAFTEGAERGYVADLTGAGRRGAAFGIYHAATAGAALVGPLTIGALYDEYGAGAAFTVAGGTTLAALVLLLTVVRARR